MNTELFDLVLKSESKIFYLYCEQEIIDFTKQDVYTLNIFSKEKNIQIVFDKASVVKLRSDLKICLFNNKEYFLLGWNFKNLVSYFSYFVKNPLEIACNVRDLRVLEYYEAKYLEPPKTYSEALKRLNRIKSDTTDLPQILKIYQTVYSPLIREVLPHIETTGLVNNNEKITQHAYYDITEKTSRLKTYRAFSRGFSPLNLDSAAKEHYSAGYDEIFLNFDFNGFEVFVLQWLSQDQELKGIIDNGGDLYSLIFEKIFERKCELNERNLVKKIFLPVIYGQTSFTLSEILKNSDTTLTANEVSDRIYSKFETALNWVHDQLAFFRKNSFCLDYFGRKRNFKIDEEFAVRNFVVQSPAAIICLEKLILLYNQLKKDIRIPLYVHDGYYLAVHKDNWQEIYKQADDLLSSESELCKGLKLRVVCKGGRNLNNLKLIRRKNASSKK